MMRRTKQRENGRLLLAKKRSKNLVACYSYWPISSNKDRDTLIEQSLYSKTSSHLLSRTGMVYL